MSDTERLNALLRALTWLTERSRDCRGLVQFGEAESCAIVLSWRDEQYRIAAVSGATAYDALLKASRGVGVYYLNEKGEVVRGGV